MTLLAVLLGGALGAPLRYVLDLAVQRRHETRQPWGTFTVNVIGSLVLGLTLGAASGGGLSPMVVAFVGTGICGALTTFSTFGFETVRLLEEGAVVKAVTNVALSLVVGLGLGALGWFVGAALA